MRTIRFRGQDLMTLEWRYGYLYQINLEGRLAAMILTTDNLHSNNSIAPRYHLAFTLGVDLFLVKPETVGQFTGLEDQNGVEIFEGDVVEVTSLHPDSFMKKMKAVIIYDDDLCCYDFKATDRQRCMCNTIPDCHIEVIGNIHEEGEL